ncbi:hypothetical protein Tco_1055063 [Tanacetum coccineum]|uniref:Uncharacterized protein n=1 Tax=Tanacetum coccineum TaxID=301880 RepID=A0ABQ5GYJ9_9ASTR
MKKKRITRRIKHPKTLKKPTEAEAKKTVKEIETKDGTENETRNESIKTLKNDKVVEAPGSQPVAYYLMHKINEKLINGLVKNNRFNNSLPGTQVGKKKKKAYNILPKDLIRDLKHVNALVDQGSDVNVMPYSTYLRLTDEGPTETDIRLSLASHSYIYPLGIAEDVLVEIKEKKRLFDLKEQEKKSEEELKKLLNPATLKALALKKEPIMRITDPLDLTVYPKFRLKMLSFSEWLEAKKLGLSPPPELATFELTTEDKKGKRTELLKEVFVKERIEVDGTQRNLTPPLGVIGKKGLVIREPEARFFYFNANFDLVFQRELEFHVTSTVQLIRLLKHINQDSPEAREMYKIIELEIESKDDVNKAREIVRTNSDGMGIDILRGEEDQLSATYQLALKGLSECKASKSNIRHIQVKDIIKEVKDNLKTYLSARMDIS